MKEKYNIPEENFGRLKENLDRLAKKAEKCGMTPPQITILREYDVDKKNGFVRRWYEIELTGEEPKLAGWSFLGTLQFVKGDDGEVSSLLRSVPGKTIPEKYRSASQKCDHCGIERFRIDNYILQHENGETKQVGSTCLKDFLGNGDPHAFASYASCLIEFQGYAEYDEERFENDNINFRRIDLMTFLILCASTIRVRGFISRKTANEKHCTSTADDVYYAMVEHSPEIYKQINEEDKVLAGSALLWARSIFSEKQELNDYEYNLKVACSSCSMETRLTGLVASLIPFYQREHAKEQEIKAIAKVSNWIGQIKEKIEIHNIELTGHFTTFGEYGETQIYKFKDETGNRYVWFASNMLNKNIGDIFNLKGTVKAHNEFKGIKETALTRCKII